ncbi:MAG: hypothetical protein AAFQ64_19670 [Pseudomonadota bacterium]
MLQKPADELIKKSDFEGLPAPIMEGVVKLDLHHSMFILFSGMKTDIDSLPRIGQRLLGGAVVQLLQLSIELETRRRHSASLSVFHRMAIGNDNRELSSPKNSPKPPLDQHAAEVFNEPIFRFEIRAANDWSFSSAIKATTPAGNTQALHFPGNRYSLRASHVAGSPGFGRFGARGFYNQKRRMGLRDGSSSQ